MYHSVICWVNITSEIYKYILPNWWFACTSYVLENENEVDPYTHVPKLIHQVRISQNPYLLQFLSGVFKRGRNYELKITEDMLYGTEDYQQPSPTMSRSYTKVG